MRCPNCAARNAEAAAWCTQCYQPFTPPGGPDSVEVPPTEGGADAPPARRAGTASPPPVPEPPGADVAPGADAGADAAERDVRVRGEVVEWRCAACEGWTPLEAPSCATCASPRAGFGPASTRSVQDPSVALGPALAASALLPGLGHLLRGAVGTGLGRAVLWLLWAGGGLALARSAGLGTGAVVLLLAAVVLWAVSLVDLQRHAAGAPPLATPRVLAWSVVGVTLLLVSVLLGGTMGRGAP